MNNFQPHLLQANNFTFKQLSLVRNVVGKTYTVHLAGNHPPPNFISQQLSSSSTQYTLGEIILGVGLGIALVGGVIIVVEILNNLFGPVRNDEPLTSAMRSFIRERDNETCFYCGDYAPYGHVDHHISRANGGSNGFENLSWSCAPCNWRKGPLNDDEFIRLYA